MNNEQRNRGTPRNFDLGRGGVPAPSGPVIGIVVNNVDNTRSGRLQVVLTQFSATKNGQKGSPQNRVATQINLKDENLWRTVSYCPPFYGSTTQISGTDIGAGTYPGNPNSYGMWFTPPDLYTKVICFFPNGDGVDGIYLACLPINNNHMIPAIGSSTKYTIDNTAQANYFANVLAMPVTEINELNPEISNSTRFFDQIAPVQKRVAGILLQQGLIRDPVRGPISSSSQRESPSAAYGISTPGRAIYQGVKNDPKTIRAAVASGKVKLQDINVIGREGGHTFVMDDGDLDGKDTLVRIRTAKGHQITMSDDGDCFYITHANGQTWIELGKQGTVDVFSTNSVNIRTQGILNLHADKGINMYSGGAINIKSKASTTIQASALNLIGEKKLTVYSKGTMGILSASSLSMSSKSGSWNAGSSLSLTAGTINLNGGSAKSVKAPTLIKALKLANVVWQNNQGWVVQPNSLPTIVTRAPTHEPYPYHGEGVNATAELAPADKTISAAEPTGLAARALNKAINIATTAVIKGISPADFLEEIPTLFNIGI